MEVMCRKSFFAENGASVNVQYFTDEMRLKMKIMIMIMSMQWERKRELNEKDRGNLEEPEAMQSIGNPVN